MVSINPSDPDYRNTTTSTTPPVPSRELPVEPEPASTAHIHSRVLPLSGTPWGGIIAGSVVAIAILGLSISLAVACGVPGYVGGAYGVGSGFWIAITAIIALFVGGMVAGMAPPYERMNGAIRGFVTWSLTVVLTALFSTSAFGLIHGATVGNGQPMGVATGLGTFNGAAWGTFAALVLGLIFGIVGGMTGAAMGTGKMRTV